MLIHFMNDGNFKVDVLLVQCCVCCCSGVGVESVWSLDRMGPLL